MVKNPKPLPPKQPAPATPPPPPTPPARDDYTLTIRVSTQLRDALYDAAEAEHRSLNSLSTVFLEAGLQAMGRWPPDGGAKRRPMPFWTRTKPK